jgi:hypothetical protein
MGLTIFVSATATASEGFGFADLGGSSFIAAVEMVRLHNLTLSKGVAAFPVA